VNNLPIDQAQNVRDANFLFPEEYTIPPLPNSLLKDVEEGALRTFGPHYANRQILVDAVAFDLIGNYKLL
jgi:hypothetical protein